MNRNVMNIESAGRRLWLSESFLFRKTVGVRLSLPVPAFGRSESSLYSVHIVSDDSGKEPLDIRVEDSRIVFSIAKLANCSSCAHGTVDLPGGWWRFDYYLACCVMEDVVQIQISLWRHVPGPSCPPGQSDF